MDGTPDMVVRFGSFELDLLRRELRSGGRVVALGSRAFDALALLVEQHGVTVDRDTLIHAVWPGRVVEDNNLAQAIRRIRHALSTHSRGNDYVVTVAGRGYRFVAPLQPTRSRHGCALAVLAFQDVGGTPGDNRATGLAEALVVALGAAARIPVRSSAACAALPPDLDGVAAGRLLEVSHVVEGAVQHIDAGLRLSIRLVDTASGLTPWARVIDVFDDMAAVTSLADEICALLPSGDGLSAGAVERRKRETA